MRKVYTPTEQEPYLKSRLSISNIRTATQSEQEKYLSKASIDNLRPLLPQNVNLENNPDLLAVAFDAWVVDRINRNDDGTGKEESLALVKNFYGKPFNVEHKTIAVVGFCTGYGFSKFGTSEVLTLEEVEAMNEPFNVVLYGFVWKRVNPAFAAALESSNDPTSDKYESISASWEVGFSEYEIIVGHKNFNSAKVIDTAEELDKYDSYLKCNGGLGIDPEGQPVYRKLVGTILPLGLGFVENPAAEVVGVAVASKNPTLEERVEAAVTKALKNRYENMTASVATLESVDSTENNKELATMIIKMMQEQAVNTLVAEAAQKENVTILENNSQSSSQLDNNDVKENSMSTKLKNISDITDESLKTITASAISDLLQEKLTEEVSKYNATILEKENAVANATEKVTALEATVADLTTKLSALEASNAAREQNEKFQARMAGLDSTFTLEDELKTILASEIKDLDDAGFDLWLKRFEIVAKDKKKVEKPTTTSVATASATAESDATAALAAAEAEKTRIANAGSTSTPSFADRFNAAFSPENLIVNKTNKKNNK